MFRSWLLMRLGRVDESIMEAKRAVELDPVAPNSYNTLGSMYSYAHRVNEAIEAYRNAMALVTNREVIEANLMLTYDDGRRFPEALALAKVLLAYPDSDQYSLSSSAYTYAVAGQRADAERIAALLAKQKDASKYIVATSIVALGRTDEVFRLLSQAVAERDDYAPDLGVDPVFDSIRNDPRMNELLKRMGLPAH